MSHFTHIKTRFQNLHYLEKTLEKLDIIYDKSKLEQEESETRLSIYQLNNHEINFIWNGEEYELVTDLSFWQQSQPVETFLDKISHQYACELVIGESQKIGFKLQISKQTQNQSTTIVLDRWNIKNTNR